MFILLILILLQSTSTQPTTTTSLIQTASTNLHSGNNHLAIQYSRLAIQSNPHSIQAQQILATALTWDSKFSQAHTILQQALALHNTNNTNSSPHLHLHLHRDLGNLLNYYYPHTSITIQRIIQNYQSYLQAIEKGVIFTTTPTPVVGVHNDLALLLQSNGQIDQAVAQFQAAIQLDPLHYKTRTNYGLLLSKLSLKYQLEGLHQTQEAVRICQQLTNQGDTEATSNLPRLLLNMGSIYDALSHTNPSLYPQKALQFWKAAIELDSTLTLAIDAIGNKYAGEGNLIMASQYYTQGAAAARARNETKLALSLEIKCMTLLPRVYNTANDVIRWRWKFMNNLKKLLTKTKRRKNSNSNSGSSGTSVSTGALILEQDPARAVLSLGYYLVYQGLDNRRPREMMADLYRNVLPSIQGKEDQQDEKAKQDEKQKEKENKKEKTEVSVNIELSGNDITLLNTSTTNTTKPRIRVAFFSEYLYEHSTTKLIYNVINGLSKKKKNIDLYIIYPKNMIVDDLTIQLQQAVGGASNVILIPGISSLIETRRLIRSIQLDVLIFVEIGMGMVSYFLAFAAKTLAKKTMMFWGHGVTSGIKNGIDYFITSDQFHDDREIAQESFTEQLYFMETLTVAFQSPTEAIGTKSISSISTIEKSEASEAVEPVEEETTFNINTMIGLESGTPNIYLAPTSLYKFHPLMDYPMVEILKRDLNAVIVMVRGVSDNWSTRILKRLHLKIDLDPEIDSFEKKSIAKRRIIVIPAMDRSIYLSFLKSGSVVMLPYPTTSSVTVFETISVGTPFVSYGGSAKYLLQHYAPGILNAAGVNQKCCIAENEEEYIEKLLNIGRNRTLRKEISRELVRGSLVLFGKEMKERVVNEWESMLYDVLKK